MATETTTTPLALLQAIDTDPGEEATADLEVAICFIEACEQLVCNVRQIFAMTGTSPELFRDVKNLDIMLAEAKDKVTMGRENAGKLVEAVMAARFASKA